MPKQNGIFDLPSLIMKPYNHTDEKELLLKLRDGDQRAFDTIYNYYWPVMYSHALRMLKHEEDAQDVVQELFVTFYKKIDQLKENTNLSGYLYITLRNKIINLISQQKMRSDYLLSLSDFSEQVGNDVLPLIHEKELREIIEMEIERMPSKMRQIFELSRNEYLSHKEIASRLEISDKTVKTQINNALKLIRMRLGTVTGISIVLYLLIQNRL